MLRGVQINSASASIPYTARSILGKCYAIIHPIISRLQSNHAMQQLALFVLRDVINFTF